MRTTEVWEVREKGLREARCDHHTFVGQVGGGLVAQALSSNGSGTSLELWDRARDHARLIAAAPDLLRACNEADTAFVVIQLNRDMPLVPQAASALRRAWAAVNAAKAKATGKPDAFLEANSDQHAGLEMDQQDHQQSDFKQQAAPQRHVTLAWTIHDVRQQFDVSIETAEAWLKARSEHLRQLLVVAGQQIIRDMGASDGLPRSESERGQLQPTQVIHADPGFDRRCIEQARNEWQNDELQVDDDAIVRRARDGHGAWVAAWVWLSEIPVPEPQPEAEPMDKELVSAPRVVIVMDGRMIQDVFTDVPGLRVVVVDWSLGDLGPGDPCYAGVEDSHEFPQIRAYVAECDTSPWAQLAGTDADLVLRAAKPGSFIEGQPFVGLPREAN